MGNKEYGRRIRLTPREESLILGYRNASNTLIIGDTHIPFVHPGYLDFCQKVQEQFNCSTVLHAGDEVDNNAISYHESDPDGMSAGRELEKSKKELFKWYKAFPEVMVCIGNHTALPYRKAKTYGIPKACLKTYGEMLEAPKGWKWQLQYEIDGVLYTHGTGLGGKDAAIDKAIRARQSTVIGHIHSYGGCKYHANDKNIIFGLNVGCGIDVDAYAFEYGKLFTNKPTLGCGVVLDRGRIGIFIPMDLGSKLIEINSAEKESKIYRLAA